MSRRATTRPATTGRSSPGRWRTRSNATAVTSGGGASSPSTREGHLDFKAPGLPDVDLHKLVLLLKERGIHTPVVVRFPSMIVASMQRLHDAFEAAGRDAGFTGRHVGMFPLKVNQRRSVVETVVGAREQCVYGLEAGSKPELLLAMAQPVYAGAPLICNGYKDREFIRLAYHAAELGHEVVIVLESLREVRRYLEVNEEQDWTATPLVGMRAKLYSRGSGRWQSSGGERSKFGLTTNEMLEVVRQLEAAGKIERFGLLHFHIGSQITQIKRIKTAVREGVRIWAALRARAPRLEYIDLGGGIGIDYDGSKTSYPSSANYSVEEYASQVVFEVQEVVSELELPSPTIVTESGRVLVAKHAVTIAGSARGPGRAAPGPGPVGAREQDHQRAARDPGSHHGQEHRRVLPRRGRLPRRGPAAVLARVPEPRGPGQRRGPVPADSPPVRAPGQPDAAAARGDRRLPEPGPGQVPGQLLDLPVAARQLEHRSGVPGRAAVEPRPRAHDQRRDRRHHLRQRRLRHDLRAPRGQPQVAAAARAAGSRRRALLPRVLHDRRLPRQPRELRTTCSAAATRSSSAEPTRRA